MKRTALAVVAAAASVPLTAAAADLTVDTSLGNSPYAVSADAAYNNVTVGSATTGDFTLTGGTLTVAADLRLAAASSATGALNLNGGVLQAYRVSAGSGTSTINYNGAVVRAMPNAANTIDTQTGRVRAGGASFDTNGQAMTVGTLTHDAALGATADGGLTKLGSGTLTVSGINTYTGLTAVAAGTLAVTSGGRIGGGSLAISGALTISGTGVVSPGPGTTGAIKAITIGSLNTPVATITVADTGTLDCGTMYVGGTSVLPNAGQLVQTGGTVNTNHTPIYLASTNGSRGTLDVSGGTLMTGGISIAAGVNAACAFNLSGGSVTVDGSLGNGAAIVVGASGSTGATFTQTGGTLDVGTGALVFGSASRAALVTLSGGRLSVAGVIRGTTSGGGYIQFNGGTLSPTASNASFLGGLADARIGVGGAIFDTNGFDIGVDQKLQRGTSPPTTPDGGLTKLGLGTLTLSGANTYTGPTTIVAGTLRAAPATVTPLLSNAGGVDLTGAGARLLIDHNAGSSVVAQVRGLLAAGFDNNFAAGQLRSTTANVARGLGYADDGATFTVMATLYGDADLDGGVGISDFNAMAANFGKTTAIWTQGDFDYDGGVSIADFNRLAGNFGQSLAGGPGFAPLLAFAAAHDDLRAFEVLTGVPEPATVGTWAAAGMTVLRRPRRRREARGGRQGSASSQAR